MSKRVVILGGGFGALAAAPLLARDGYHVTVVEKNEQLGGRASVLKKDGFVFDMGPSWYLMPEVFDRYFAQFGKKPSDYYDLVPLEPQYRAYFDDGTLVDIPRDIDETAAVFDRLEPGSGKMLQKYLTTAQEYYRLAMDHFLYTPMQSYRDLCVLPLRAYPSLLQSLRSMHSAITSTFRSTQIYQLLTYPMIFLGCSPTNAPSLFRLMNYVDFKQNVYYPMGGMSAVVSALVALGKEYGVEYRVNTPVETIVVRDGKVSKVVARDQEYRADLYVSNASYPHTESLFSDQSVRRYPTKYWQKKVITPSAFLLYLGLDTAMPDYLHHTFVFSDAFEQHFEHIFGDPAWPQNPSIYVNAPSKTDSTLAPAGSEVMTVLVPIAPGLTASLAEKKRYAEHIVQLLEQKVGAPIRPHIVTQQLFSVEDFSQRYNAYEGNAFGDLSNTLLQSMLFRPPFSHAKLDNLFFVGTNTQPGVGVPPALISAQLLQAELHKMYRTNT